MGERFHEIWQRIKADIHRNPGLWIGVGISAVILVIAYLAYRRSTGLNVPANGYGFPDYGSASGGGGGSLGGTGYQPYQPTGPIGQPITNPFNPFNPVSSLFPPFPTFGFGPPSGIAPSSGQEDSAAFGLGGYAIQGTIQNPTAAQDAQHHGIAVPTLPVQNPLAPAQQAHTGSAPVLPVVQNPTTTQDAQHQGSAPPPPPPPPPVQNPTAPSQQQHKGSTPKPAPPPPPPATLQPTNSGHGRAA